MSELRDVFERPFDGDDDPRIRLAQVLTRAEAEAVLEFRGDLVTVLTLPNSVRPEGGSTERIGGFAPGDYINRCCDCDQTFQGDKRAIQCFECATRQKQSPQCLEAPETDWRARAAELQGENDLSMVVIAEERARAEAAELRATGAAKLANTFEADLNRCGDLLDAAQAQHEADHRVIEAAKAALEAVVNDNTTFGRWMSDALANQVREALALLEGGEAQTPTPSPTEPSPELNSINGRLA